MMNLKIKIVWVCSGLFIFGSLFLQSCSQQKQAENLVKMSSVPGGLIVHLGCGDGSLTSTLRLNDGYIVHGLDRDMENVKQTRQIIRQKGLYGQISVEQLTGKTLPYIDNFVNLIIAENTFDIPKNEILRVLTPKGVALIKNGEIWDTVTKPRPDELDVWTHYLYDASGNPVSQDKHIGPLKHLQWIGSPMWARHHDHMASMSALVSSDKRIFYIMDEGSTLSIELPAKWSLVARDAFNGTILWKRRIEEWHTHLWPLKSGPAHLPRRLVVSGDRVYATLGIDAPISVLNAATGETVKVYEETAGTEELIVSNGTLFAIVNPSPVKRYQSDTTYKTVQQIRRQRGTLAFKEEKNKLLAIDIPSGERLWQKEHVMLPLTLAADQDQVYFHNGTTVVSLDRTDGEMNWQSKPISRYPTILSFFAPTLVVNNDVLVFAGGEFAGGQKPSGSKDEDIMTAISTETGEILWTAPHPASGYRSPEDVFVINDQVWVGETTSGGLTGTFTGRDLRNGQIENQFDPDVETYWFHHRCYRARATEDYLLTSRTGIEYLDPDTQHWQIHHWVRGGCLYGIMPSNGLVYAPPHDCICYPESKLSGFSVLASQPRLDAGSALNKITKDQRLQRGEIYNTSINSQADENSHDWPTYRHDAFRSGMIPMSLPAKLENKWQTPLPGKLSSVVVAEGKLFVASVDEHTLYALDANNGDIRWQYTTGGRIDSPPTLYKGRVLFGSADGWIYCLQANDGKMVWRYLAAPADQRMMAYEQLESVWPVHGNVMIQDDVLYSVAGRSMFVDGGIRFLRLDPLTGEKVSDVMLNEQDPETQKNLQSKVKYLTMPVALSDILSSDGEYVYMRSQRFDMMGNRQEVGPGSRDRFEVASQQSGVGKHLFCPTGFLDGSWYHRTYWVFGRKFVGGWNGYYLAGKYAPSGRILVFDENNVYGYGRKPEYYRWTTPLEYQLFASQKSPDLIIDPDKPERDKRNQRVGHTWSADVPILVRGMVLADQTLFIAGPPDVMDEEKVAQHLDDDQITQQIQEQQAALDGEKGGLLQVVAANTGEKLSEYKLQAPPVWDGMAAAYNKLYLATTDGRVVCYGGVE